MTHPGGGGFRIGEGIVEITADDTGLRGEVRRAVREAGAGQRVNVPVHAEMGGFTRDVNGRLHDARGRFVSEGRLMGRRFGDSFSDEMSRTMRKRFRGFFQNIPDLIPIPKKILAIAAALVPLASALGGLVSSLGLGLTSITAILPMLFGVGAAFGVILGSLKGVTKRTDEASVKLTSMLKSWQEELKVLQRIAGDEFLPGVTYMLNKAKTLLPDIKKYTRDLAVELHWVAMEVGDLVASDLFRDRLRVIMQNNTFAVRYLSQAVGSLGIAFMDVSAAASPLVQRLARAIKLGSDNLAIWLETKYVSGELDVFFQRAGDSMAKWGRIVWNILAGLVNILRAANPAGEQLAGNLEDVTRRFKEWTASTEGQKRLRSFFEFILNIDYSRIFRLAAAIGAVTLALKALTGVQTVTSVVAGLVSLGPAGWVVLGVAAAVVALAGGLAYLYQSSEPVRSALHDISSAASEQLLPSFKRAMNFIADEVAPTLKDGLGVVLGDIKDIIVDGLIPGLKGMYENYLPKIEKAWKSLTKTLKDNEDEIKTLVEWIKKITTILLKYVLPVLGTVVGFMAMYIVGTIQRVVTVISFFVKAIKWIGGAFVTVKDTVVSVWNSVYEFLASTFASTKDTVMSVVDSISGAFTSVWQTVSGVLQSIWNVVSSVFNAIAGTIQLALNIIQQIFIVVFTWIYNLVWSRITLVRDIVSSVLNTMSTAVKIILDRTKELFRKAWEWIDDVTGGKLTAIKEFITNTINTIKETIANVLAGIRLGWNIAWGWIRDTTSTIWNTIKRKVSDAIGTIRSSVKTGLDYVRDRFSSISASIKGIWDTAWTWIYSKVTSWIGKIKNVVGSLKDHMTTVFRSIPRAVVAAINAFLGVADKMIGLVNKILPDRLDIPRLGRVSVPAGYAQGGMIRGPGTGTSDSIPLMTSMGPIMGSNGEFMIRARSTRGLAQDFGAGFLDWLNNYDVRRGDQSTARLRPKGYSLGGLVTSTQEWIQGQDPKPYILGSNGPGAWDCSSLVGGVWAILTGRDPYRRYFTTYTLPGAGGFVPGHGLYTIGLSREHVVGNLAGLAFEAANPSDGILTGAAATSVDRMPAQFYLPQLGEGFVPGGSGQGGGLLASVIKRAIDNAVASVRGQLPQPGGILNNLVTGMFDKTVAGLRAMEFDRGGLLGPGATLALNRTGAPETVRTAEQEAALRTSPTYNITIMLDPTKIKSIEDLVEIVNNLQTTARRYGAKVTVK